MIPLRRILLGLPLGLACAGVAEAQEAPRRFDVPAQRLSSAVLEFARQSHSEIFMQAALLEGRSSQPVLGVFTPQDALDRLLQCTGFVGTVRDGLIRIRRGAVHAAECGKADELVS